MTRFGCLTAATLIGLGVASYAQPAQAAGFNPSVAAVTQEAGAPVEQIHYRHGYYRGYGDWGYGRGYYRHHGYGYGYGGYYRPYSYYGYGGYGGYYRPHHYYGYGGGYGGYHHHHHRGSW
jgi:hypothetical protein